MNDVLHFSKEQVSFMFENYLHDLTIKQFIIPARILRTDFYHPLHTWLNGLWRHYRV
jgi:hypothetical protein